jgi:glycogen debranching enzyme
MTVKINVGPPVLTINRGSTFMVTDYRGQIDPLQAQGVFADDTRFVSGYRLSINGKPWERISSATVSYHSDRLYLTNPLLQAAFGDKVAVGAGSLELKLVRAVDEGIHETFAVTNYGLAEVAIVLELELQSDFADLFEVKTNQLKERENVVTEWNGKRAELATTYRNRDYLCRFTYKIAGANPAPSYANGRLRFPIHLAPGASWQASGRMLLQHGRRVRKPQARPAEPGGAGGRKGRLHERWLETCTRLETPNEDLRHAYLQSVEDMGALRIFDRDLGPDVWVPAAGVPWYVTLFGRDTLIASLQNLMVHARFAQGALRILAEYQAHQRDDWRDAQPGKIVHEVRHGELAHFNLVPHARYYGTWDATALYLLALHAAWRWLGDRKLLEDLRPVAERCLQWIDHYGDLDGDGFQEYQTFSPQGYNNMSWKDAEDAVVYPDGSQVKQPKALCELQGYVYAAKQGMAELFDALGDRERAKALRSQAATLKHRFNQAYWMEDQGTYAFGLDPDKQQIATVASNAGHCLWTGIADDDKAGRVVERLLADDMWTGWGIRTLSSDNPAYDPFSYQRGSVWPHDNAIIAAGMKRYGFHDQANRVAGGILDAASRFQSYRLPEVFAGLQREPSSFPVQYRGANIPQAWAAGSVFQFVQTMLGLEADVPNGRLWVEPTLPDWAPLLELDRLAVGNVRLKLRFWREGAQSRFSVESQQGGKLEARAKARSRPGEKVA